ncbi:ribosomal RNA large subunit methyltransferase G-like [Siniperca chuatsi]|uniref:ribosomal RNA large subunit methyltransferase G-like n=1 Tax=Siniperca chuatsi TaxID=119488 RepID=UPI001CE1B3DD|nr:ribosomal RNA large subunit methyltransferase G-like [Siniperca chuatsi]
MALLEQQLRALRKVVTPETRIIADPRPDHHDAGVEKARLINCTFSAPELADAPETLSWKLEGTDWTIHNHANVFSRTGLDIGARFFMEHLPENLEGEIVDLGCGNGVIGLTLLAKNPDASVCVQRRVADGGGLQSSERGNQHAGSAGPLRVYDQQRAVGRRAVPLQRRVHSNPPFHQKHALTDNVAWGDVPPRAPLPENQRRVAVHRGEPPPDYFHKLKKIFGNCVTVATNNKFVVLKAVKLGRRR